MTEISLFKRIEMLSDTWTYRIYNNAVQLIGLKNQVWGFSWEGSIDERTCNRCDKNIGREYRLGQFMPSLPIHVFCRCSWRVIEK